MKKRLRILLCNDDGILAPGIKSLWRGLQDCDFADLCVIAPAVEKSGVGAAITWDRPLLIRKVEWPNNTPAWSVDGTPADCIKLANRIILESPPDFIVSGINAGSNAGRNVLHSGTVGAVIEGLFRGIPGIAFSYENGEMTNYAPFEKYIEPILRYALDHPLPHNSFFNVNFPHTQEGTIRGIRLTRQGKGRWAEDPSLHLETDSGSSYWMGGKPEEITEDMDCDIALLREGYLTVAPICVHELTHFTELEKRRPSFESYFTQIR